MNVSAKLEFDWSRNLLYIARKRSVTDDRQTDNGVYRAARSQLKTVQSKMADILASIGKKAVTAFWVIFIYSTNFEINTNILHQVFLLQMNFSLITTIFLSKHDTLKHSCCNIGPTCITEGETCYIIKL